VPLAVTRMPDMVTTAGGTTSNAIGIFDDAWAISIYSPATTFTSTYVTIQVEPTSTGTDFVTLQSGGSDVTLSSGAAMVISPLPFMQLRIVHDAAEAAARTFTVRKTILT
jgi:hypothetical protein